MKSKLIFLHLFALVIGMVACEKSKDFVDDNTIPTGLGYRPVSGNTLQYINSFSLRSVNLGTSSSGATAFPADTTFNTELQFFSQSPIQQFELYNTIGAGTRTLVDSWPYTPAYSAVKAADTLLIPYTIPMVATGTVIKLEYDILNENGLRLPTPRTVYVKVK